MRIFSGRTAAAKVEQLAARHSDMRKTEASARAIVKNVRSRGDSALRRYAERWDGLKHDQALKIPKSELQKALRSISRELRQALGEAAGNIRRFCEWQKPVSWSRNCKGISLGQLVRPLDSVGCYVPGGRYPLVSTVLMTVIPAQVAGVRRIALVSPKPSSEILAAAAFLGVDELYRVGGAHAIAALAYGTRTIPAVDKIVGPGNAYVTAAKKLVSFDCAIDFLAGPTEAIVMSDSGEATFIAADLVCQAEHDPDALAVFITTSRKLARSVQEEVTRRSGDNPTARASILRNGAILLAASHSQAREWANTVAAEHITLSQNDLPFIQNAGSIFVGDYSAQAAGDYASGPNHVLPTGGQARFRGGLSVLDFVKVITVQNLSASGLERISRTVQRLAEIEGLSAHASSIRVRFPHA